MAFCIITDSASDIPESTKERYDLYVMPTPVMVDGVDYLDGETIFQKEFYELQKSGHEISTYHISQAMFIDHFTKFARRGDEVLYICFSTGIAGTYQAANLAVEDVREYYPDFEITIIDSKCASIGFGLVVEKLLQMQKNGARKELIIEAASYFCQHMRHAVTVDTLDYLYKGGRISRASFMVGGLLDIKPIITVDEEGVLVATEKVRGFKRSIRRVAELVKEQGVNLEHQLVGLVCGDDPRSRREMEFLLKDFCGVRHIMSAYVGCAIGVHTGPGLIGVVFQDEICEKYEQYLDKL